MAAEDPNNKPWLTAVRDWMRNACNEDAKRAKNGFSVDELVAAVPAPAGLTLEPSALIRRDSRFQFSHKTSKFTLTPIPGEGDPAPAVKLSKKELKKQAAAEAEEEAAPAKGQPKQAKGAKAVKAA